MLRVGYVDVVHPTDATGVAAQVGLCISIVGVGAVCDVQRWCVESAVCVAEYSGDDSGICRARCTGSCPSGQTCYELGDGSGACLPD